MTPILHARTYTRRVQTARDHAQSHTWSRTVARTSLQYLGPIRHASGDSRLDPSTHRKRAVDTVSMAQAAAPIVPVPPGTTASKNRAALAVRVARSRGRWQWDVCISQGRIGEASRGHGRERRTSTSNGFENAPPPADAMSSLVLAHHGESRCIPAERQAMARPCQSRPCEDKAARAHGGCPG